MRNVLLAIILGFAAMCVAGCQQQNGQTSSVGGSTSTTAARPAPAASEQQIAPATPPPARNTTTQPLPAGWSYLSGKELSDGPLKK